MNEIRSGSDTGHPGVMTYLFTRSIYYAIASDFSRLALQMQLSSATEDSRDPPTGSGNGGVAMNVERWIRVIAGTFVLASLGLGWYVSPWFLLFTAFVGLNLFQSGWTNWCLMEKILIKLGVPER
jgi:Protein of unknown function (DUF2892)